MYPWGWYVQLTIWCTDVHLIKRFFEVCCNYSLEVSSTYLRLSIVIRHESSSIVFSYPLSLVMWKVSYNHGSNKISSLLLNQIGLPSLGYWELFNCQTNAFCPTRRIEIRWIGTANSTTWCPLIFVRKRWAVSELVTTNTFVWFLKNINQAGPGSQNIRASQKYHSQARWLPARRLWEVFLRLSNVLRLSLEVTIPSSSVKMWIQWPLLRMFPQWPNS